MPTYQEMVVEAIKSMKRGRKGLSRVAIARWLQGNYTLNQKAFQRSLRDALKKGVAEGVFETTTGYSFRLSRDHSRKVRRRVRLKPEFGHLCSVCKRRRAQSWRT